MTVMKKAFLFIVWMIALSVNAQTAQTQKHEIQSGETLYSIARQYNVTVSTLLQMNPGLQADYIMAGQKINVPASSVQQNQPVQTATPVQEVKPTTAVQPAKAVQPATAVQPVSSAQTSAAQVLQSPIRPKYKTVHEVQKKETIYSLSRQYGITEEMLIEANPHLKKGKLKKGTILNIPYTVEENNQYNERIRQAEEEAKKPKVQKYESVKAAVILPYSRTEASMTPEAQKMANLYQGFLLAVDSLKLRGCSVDVYAYDETGNAISNILQQPAMKEMQLIVGPVRQYNIAPVAKFAHENGIVHVVPLANDLTLVNEHPTMFQVNVAYSLIYNQVFNRFISMHKGENIIFVGMNDKGDNMPFVSSFKKALDEGAHAYKNVNVNEFSTIKEMLRTDVRNMVIPTSGSSAAFESLCKKLDALNLTSEYDVQLFGYPEWQTLATKHEKHLSKYHCQFFTSFYSNGGAARTQLFNSRFRRWFHQDQYSSFPRYGELGYDIGAYFIKGLNDFGSAFQENLHNYSYISMEFPFNFEKKNAWSGYQNKSLLIVTYRADGTVNVR